MNAPFSNCRFRECDLPGQCRGEGKCHHPAVSAADRSEPRTVPDAVVCAIQAYGDARADNGDSAAAILHVINLIRAELAAPVADSAMAKDAERPWRTREFVMARLKRAAKEPPDQSDPGNYKRNPGDCWRTVLLSDLQELLRHLNEGVV